MNVKPLSKAMQKQLANYKKALAEAKTRFLEVFRYGDAVISDWDLKNGYDADFFLCRIPILANTIKFYNREIRKLESQRLPKTKPVEHNWDWTQHEIHLGTQVKMEFDNN